MWKILRLSFVCPAIIAILTSLDVLELDLLALGAEDDEQADTSRIHAEVMGSGNDVYYPSASDCRQCHPDHYREWSVSPHAYAQMSPVFNAMHGKIFKLTNGSNGDFCIRCHSPVGMNTNEAIFMSNIDRSPTSREGVTCVVCHRVNKNYGKISGRLALQSGNISQTIYGPKGDPHFSETFRRDIEKKMGEGKVHESIEPYFNLVEPVFCGMCHDVNLLNGFRLEEAFSEFKRSPAAKRGLNCNDCHMGKVPGVFSGDKATNYENKKIAKIGARWVGEPRKKTDHMFAGPDHSVIHPGIFPHNDEAAEFASIREWLQFDHETGWGTDEFEETEEPARKAKGEGTSFPSRWSNIDERYEARDILIDQIELLEEYQRARLAILQAGFGLGEIQVLRAKSNGVAFRIEVKNLTDGHQVPTGFIAERTVYLNVQVYNQSGILVFESGDLDPNYDVRDLHSLYVHNRELPQDRQLFSLQSTFITRNIRGGEREQVLSIPYSVTPLPFVRPAPSATTLTGRPGNSRIHKKNIKPLGHSWAKYEIPAKDLSGPGKYTVNARLIAGMVPVNLIDEIKDVGFDYGMSAYEVALGIRFGIGDVKGSSGERSTRKQVEALADDPEGHDLGQYRGLTGGHTVIQELGFEFIIE